MNRPQPAETMGLSHWHRRWEAHQARSVLRRSQVASPERWAAFYEAVAGLWDRLTGMGPETSARLASELLSQEILKNRDSVLELGCGPGHLSLALAGKGLDVTALDLSPAMIQRLETRAAARDALPLSFMASDWKTLPQVPAHDIVLAACFPEAFSPEGIARMEALARKSCVLIMGQGPEVFPLRRRIWDKVMDQPCPSAGFHLEWALGYLGASGRHPRSLCLSLPAVMDAGRDEVSAFFHHYFSMFGLSRSRVARAVEEVLAPFADQGRIRLQGEVGLAVVAWEPGADRGRDHG